ncbi:MAG: C40 family peptidase [Fimbriimonadaceae bacterium]|nr:C40 family peptidase [Fimbriimonadaceae bacterium]
MPRIGQAFGIVAALLAAAGSSGQNPPAGLLTPGDRWVLPSGAEITRAESQGELLAAAEGTPGVAWISRSLSGRTLVLRRANGSVTTWPMPADLEAGRLAWIGSSLGLLNDQGGELWDPATKSLVTAEKVLPAPAAALLDRSHVIAGPGGLLAFIRPFALIDVEGGRRTQSAITMFAQAGPDWRELGTTVTTAPRYRQIRDAKFDRNGRYQSAGFSLSALRIALTEEGFVALEDEAVLQAPLTRPAWVPKRMPVQGPTPLWSEPMAVSGGRLWRSTGGRLTSQSLEDGTWNAHIHTAGPLKPLRLEPDGSGGIWAVEPTRAVRFHPTTPTPGAFWLPMGRTAELTQPQQTLIQELESWLDTPYALGGTTRSGVDCSGLAGQVFQRIGITLPRTSEQIRSAGTPVTGELKVGDLIWTPGHVAVYVGNGETIEAVNAGVKRMTLWRFTGFEVRRVLP